MLQKEKLLPKGCTSTLLNYSLRNRLRKLARDQNAWVRIWLGCGTRRNYALVLRLKDVNWIRHTTHWEELLQSVSNFIFRLIISKHYRCRSRGLRGFKRSEKLCEIWNYSLPGRPSTHHWVKSKTIIEKHQKLRKVIINQLLVNFLPPKNIF